MPTFAVLLYTLETLFFSIILGTDSRIFFLYERGTNKYNDSSLDRIKDLPLEKLVMYITRSSFVGNLTLQYSVIPNKDTTKIFSYDNEVRESNCYYRGRGEPDESIFMCNNIARIVVIRSRISLLSVTYSGFDTFVEKYVGCYSAAERLPVTQLNDLEACRSKCKRTPYFGMKMRSKCLCIKNLNLLTTENLDLCTMSCRNHRYQLCGAKDYISVYTREAFLDKRDYYFPSWECTYNQEKCPICPDGKKGLNCDIIDCFKNNGECGNQTCQSFFWVNEDIGVCSCRSGFHIDLYKNCIDVDECDVLHRCDPSSTFCVNNEGSYTCRCQIGYIETDNQSMCTDIDECITGRACHYNFTKCRNLPGSFVCDCLPGFRKADRHRCKDVDECSELRHNCGRMSVCLNRLGSFECICPVGTLQLDYVYIVECQDIDECLEENICNKSVSICLNTLGTYICQCTIDYSNVDNYNCSEKVFVKISTVTEGDYSISTPSSSTEIPIHTVNLFLILFLALACLLTCSLICICFIFWYRRKAKSSTTLSTSTALSAKRR